MGKKDLKLLLNPARPRNCRSVTSAVWDPGAEYRRLTGQSAHTLTIDLYPGLRPRLRAVPDPAALMSDDSGDLILFDLDPEIPVEALPTL